MGDITESNENNVVSFTKPSETEHENMLTLRISGEIPKYPKCKHGATEIDETNRTLKCKKCGVYLDVFDWVMDKVKLGQSIVGDINGLYRERDSLRQRVESLQKEERNVKARLRTAKTRLLFEERSDG